MDRPFGIKIYALLSILGGIVGAPLSLLGSEIFLRESYTTLGYLINNITLLRIILFAYSIFFLWLGYITFYLKKNAWNYLLLLFITCFVVDLTPLIILSPDVINTGVKVGIAVRLIIDALWFFYVFTRKPFFVY